MGVPLASGVPGHEDFAPATQTDYPAQVSVAIAPSEVGVQVRLAEPDGAQEAVAAEDLLMMEPPRLPEAVEMADADAEVGSGRALGDHLAVTGPLPGHANASRSQGSAGR